MQETLRWQPPFVLALSCVVALAACGSDGSDSAPSSTLGPPRLSEDEVIAAAIQQASHIIQDTAAQEASARYTTYVQALAEAGLQKPEPPTRADDSPVWLVRLKGLFYEPPGPAPVPHQTPRPAQATCSELIILLDDSTGQYFDLTLRTSGSCS